MNEPEMYSPNQASQLGIDDVVERARACGTCDAQALVDSEGVPNPAYPLAKEVASDLYSAMHVADSLGCDKPRMIKALKMLFSAKPGGKRIEIKKLQGCGGSVKCKVE